MKTLQRYIHEDRDRWEGLFTDYIDNTTNLVTRKNFVNALSVSQTKGTRQNLFYVFTSWSPICFNEVYMATRNKTCKINSAVFPWSNMLFV